jgi:TrmH family RNA methyltransferase
MTHIEITSRKNSLISETCKLTDKRERDKTGLFLAEGIKLLEEAVLSGCIIEKLFYTDKALKTYGSQLEKAGAEQCYLVSDEVYAKLSQESAPQGVMCCIKQNISPTLTKEEYTSGKFLILEDVQNPLNIGAIFRCAYSMGYTKIIMTDKCADPYGPKTVRAAMGSLFKIQLYRTQNICETIDNIKSSGNRVFCTALAKESLVLGNFDFHPNDSVIIGNEGHGISDDTLSHSTNSIFIPMNKNAESLNAATAAAIVLWEMNKNSLINQ